MHTLCMLFSRRRLTLIRINLLIKMITGKWMQEQDRSSPVLSREGKVEETVFLPYQLLRQKKRSFLLYFKVSKRKCVENTLNLSVSVSYFYVYGKRITVD